MFPGRQTSDTMKTGWLPNSHVLWKPRTVLCHSVDTITAQWVLPCASYVSAADRAACLTGRQPGQWCLWKPTRGKGRGKERLHRSSFSGFKAERASHQAGSLKHYSAASHGPTREELLVLSKDTFISNYAAFYCETQRKFLWDVFFFSADKRMTSLHQSVWLK